MYDFSELKPNGKEMAVAILVAVAVLVVIFCAGYMFGIRNAGTGVPDNGDGVSHIREQLGTAQSINEKLQRELAAQKTELHVLKQESSALLNQLSNLQQQSQKQQDLLINANKSLEQYAIEAKRERLRIKAQRNTWIAATLLACIGVAIK